MLPKLTYTIYLVLFDTHVGEPDVFKLDSFVICSSLEMIRYCKIEFDVVEYLSLFARLIFNGDDSMLTLAQCVYFQFADSLFIF